MTKISIFGVGLIGGSFALALKKGGFAGRILGVSSAATLERALRLGVVDEAATADRAAAESDLIYLSQPVGRIVETLGWLKGRVRPDALVTDAGSTKGAVVRAAESLTPGVFLGGHPLAGKESRGIGAADPDLFRGRTYVLTPAAPGDMDGARATEFVKWIRRIGAIPAIMAADRHDWIVAQTSHLPQLLSTCLAAALSETMTALEASQISGPALSDSTRLALSPFDVWADILETNLPAVREAVDRYLAKLTAVREALGSTNSELRDQWEAGAKFAREIRGSRTDSG